MQLWSRQNLSGAGILVICLMLANFLNFAFNAFLGRQLSYEQFGLLTFYNTILFLAAIFFGALGGTVNHRTAYLNGKYGHEAGWMFTRFVRRNVSIAMAAMTVLWLALSGVLASQFQITDLASVVVFSPIFLFGAVVGINKGFLQGNLNFQSVALVVVVEPLIKLVVAGLMVYWGYADQVYLAIPLSLFASFAMSMFLVSNKTVPVDGDNKFRFPKRFLAAAVVTGLSTTAFLSLDVVMVKHFMDPVTAGHYSLLSLVGKMVFFLGTLLNGFMITFVSHDAGERKNSRRTFYRLFGAASLLTAVGVLVFGVFGQHTIPVLLGDKVIPILGYLVQYSIAIGMFTLAAVIVVYHLAREQYSFSFLALGLTLSMCLGIFMFHDSIQAVVSVVFWSSLVSLTTVAAMHSFNDNSRFLFANLVDLAGVFSSMPAPSALKSGGKRILVFNWRDTKHVFAGGAEVYVHELGKRWVKDGHQVTLFCGNDGRSKRNETVGGIHVIRRGGFYFVYLWAFVYYITRFRGRYDLIVDCHNGIPFFTPLYAKEKIYSVIHHVHQEVFYKFLPKPLAWFAAVLENRLMPYAYRKIRFITVSPSTKHEMEELDITGSGIDIIYNGVDLGNLKPGKKSDVPTVLYLGRLKAYKSVDVLIKAFVKVVSQVKDAQLVIAGSGDEEGSLKKLAQELGVSDKIKFTGKINEERKRAYLQNSWVFVNPSMMEGWGITTIEAMACATPVVASDVAGLRDSVDNPNNGFLVPYGDVDAFAKKITLLLQDQKLRMRMSENATAWASNFNWDKSSQNFLHILISKRA